MTDPDLFPVIMCGGAGTRLWPTSRPTRPKQFLSFGRERSLFQETVLRVAPLAAGAGRLVVVAGARHQPAIAEQLREIGAEALLVLEPEARDSAAAMAAAAALVEREARGAVMAFVSSDHHIPDHDAFRTAVRAAAAGAQQGRIVTLGVKPTAPTSAYGYIRPQGPNLSPVDAFVEKPDEKTAARYIADGYLWNSGNFIVRSDILSGELDRHAPEVLAAARAALPETVHGQFALGDAFRQAPKISIDYAVMEKTDLASVLAVDFAWSDLGAWDAIAATDIAADRHVFENAERVFVLAPDDVVVAAIGVSDIAIVVEKDAVLVTALDQAQGVKRVVERLRQTSPGHLDFARPVQSSLADEARAFTHWLRLSALPVWATLGQREDGAFAELLAHDGAVTVAPRRARVQTRQIYVYAQAGLLGWRGPWRRAAAEGLKRLFTDYIRPDGLSRTLVGPSGEPLDETAMVYDQAFTLFALAAAHVAGLSESADTDARRLRDRLLESALENGALTEAGAHPYQANAHMHLFEAALAWEDATGDVAWARLADRLAELALSVFIDTEGGFLREFFGPDWRPAEGADGRLIEPGHQFEWAWLLAGYARRRENPAFMDAALRLYRHGLSGVIDERDVAVDALNDDGSVREARARLWPQTERLKAALILAETAETEDGRQALLNDARRALAALRRYFTAEGLWFDKLKPEGDFIDEPAPATSFYHIMVAFTQLHRTGQTLGLDLDTALDPG